MESSSLEKQNIMKDVRCNELGKKQMMMQIKV